MSHLNFYISSNNIREQVLGLCKISNNIFEISLNSSLLTDELSNSGSEFKSYAVYSEKMHAIASSLELYSKKKLRVATRVMELSLEKTRTEERLMKLQEGLELISDTKNKKTLDKAIFGLKTTIKPLEKEADLKIAELQGDLKSFLLETKKLWLLSTTLKTQLEADELVNLVHITVKIEASLAQIESVIERLSIELEKLGNRL